MQIQHFRVDQTEVFDDILVFELWNEMNCYLKSGHGCLNRAALSIKLKKFEQAFTIGFSGILSDAPG
jgi:hypothetical protein